ncbi:hypothetical protein JOF46_002902 [Paeniglutamicibacter psychrophenolicus]|uniref:Uncharacterized protein n=1 Tax=Paeniglutamicibacter psychrophenolicus TaxID=257454 RepID=A0ABS4WFK0_9MICC|nr:hypothetical protein [Paeniglutamicibacter psychrophenolicus]
MRVDPVCNLATSWTPDLVSSWAGSLKASCVLPQNIVDTRSHDIGDTKSQHVVHTVLAGGGDRLGAMTNALSPQARAAIINYDPTQPHALNVTEFCRSVMVSRSVFYKIRTRAASESTAALHPRSRAPKQPSRQYGPEVINEVVKIRKRLETDGWDYGPRSIHYDAALQDGFPGGKVPSVATISTGCSPASGRSTPHPGSGPNPPTFPSSGPPPCPCGSSTPSNTGCPTERPKRSTSSSTMPPATTWGPWPTHATRTAHLHVIPLLE